MSTKIYYGFRLESSLYLNDFLSFARKRMLEEAFEVIRHAETATGKKFEPYLDNEVAKLLIDDANSPYAEPFDVECGINLWSIGSTFVGMPIGRMRIQRTLLDDSPPWLLEYGYWNNTDPLDDVSEEDWELRRQTWEEACLNDHNATRLFHEVVNVQDLRGGLFALYREFKKANEDAVSETTDRAV